jgi:hypothetical protein
LVSTDEKWDNSLLLVAPRHELRRHTTPRKQHHTLKKEKKEKKKKCKRNGCYKKGKWSAQNKIGEKKILPEGVEIFLSATL